MAFDPLASPSFAGCLPKMNLARISILVAALLANPAAAEEDAPPGAAVELLADVSSLAPGVPFRLGVRITPRPGFHTYWQAPGIVGLASAIAWHLPDGFRAGPLRWPAPQEVEMFKHKAYGFKSEVLLVAEITPPANLAVEEPVTLAARATWMACARTCHPGTRLLTVKLPVGPAPGAANSDAFAAAAAAVPRELVLAGLQARLAGGQLRLGFTLPPNLDATGLRFIPETNLYDPNTGQDLSVDPAGRCLLNLPVMPLALESVPAALTGLLFLPAGWPQLDGARFARVSVTLAADHSPAVPAPSVETP